MGQQQPVQQKAPEKPLKGKQLIKFQNKSRSIQNQFNRQEDKIIDKNGKFNTTEKPYKNNLKKKYKKNNQSYNIYFNSYSNHKKSLVNKYLNRIK